MNELRSTGFTRKNSIFRKKTKKIKKTKKGLKKLKNKKNK